VAHTRIDPMGGVSVSSDGYKFLLRDGFISDSQPFDPVHAPTIAFLKDMSSPEKTFVDIGAHVGTYTVRMAKCYKEVVAIEPAPRFMENLKTNVKLNGLDNVTTFMVACGDGTTERLFLVDEIYSRIIFTDQLDNPALYTGESPKVVTVKVDRLDNLVKVADVVKMNAEGSEEIIVRGCTKLIESCKPVFLIQHHDNTYEGLLGMRERIREFLRPQYFALPLEHPPDPTYWFYVPTTRELTGSEEGIVRRYFHNIMENIKANRAWYHGLPYSWWHGMDLVEFLKDLPSHIAGEKDWSV
jgi:FkbM family methyltransferase